jgi:hypothetical protein
MSSEGHGSNDFVITGVSEQDLFNILQVLMTAKFDSSRSSLFMGAPILNRVISQILDYEFKTKFLADSIGRLRSTHLGARHVAEIRKLFKKAPWTGNVDMLERHVLEMAFPCRLDDDTLASIVKEARAKL